MDSHNILLRYFIQNRIKLISFSNKGYLCFETRKASTCFGNQDVIFAGPYSDRQNAQAWIAAAKAVGLSFEDFKKEMVWDICK